MSGWRTLNGTAVCLNINNIDTDQLIPARFMSQPRADGYSEFLLYDVRRDDNGTLKPDFILNEYPTAEILIAGNNFGSGSSREAAVYALIDSGIRVVIAQSFGDIFAANAINNGLLPAQVESHHWQILRQCMATPATNCKVDLNSKIISMQTHKIPLIIDETRRLKLINGWDDTDLTRQHQLQINNFRKSRYRENAWAWPTIDN